MDCDTYTLPPRGMQGRHGSFDLGRQPALPPLAVLSTSPTLPFSGPQSSFLPLVLGVPGSCPVPRTQWAAFPCLPQEEAVQPTSLHCSWTQEPHSTTSSSPARSVTLGWSLCLCGCPRVATRGWRRWPHPPPLATVYKRPWLGLEDTALFFSLRP